MIFGALLGAGASLLGGALGNKKNQEAADRAGLQGFRSNAGGVGANLGAGGSLNVNEGAFNQNARNFYQDQFNTMAGDPSQLQSFGTGILSGAVEDFPDRFNEAQQLGFQGSDAQTAQFQNFLGNQQAQNQQLGMQGIGNAFGAGSAQDVGNIAQQQAMGLFNQAGNFDQLAQNRFNQLQGMAANTDQRQTNATLQNLFGSGRLGSTGGARALEAMQQGQQNAVTNRGIQAQNFAQQQQNQMLGLGFQGLGQAQNAIGQDQSLALGQGQLGANFLNQNPNLAAMGLDASVGQDTRNISRGQQRLQNVEGMFGFGQGLQQSPIQGANAALGGMAPLDARAQQQAANALAGSQIATSGGNTAAQIQSQQTSPFGTALSGLGTGLINKYFS